MKLVKAEVFVLAKTEIWCGNDVVPGLDDYLNAIGAPNWETDSDSAGDELSEVAGRTCYNSFVPGLNPNVTKVREGNETYLGNILKERHGSVFEHSSATFALVNVSRVLTHELVRHRVGVAISQQSGRYVRLTDIGMALPKEFIEDEECMGKVNAICASVEEFQTWAAAYFKLDDPATKFGRKKAITSAMRRVAPDGRGTIIIWTANVRTLRHVVATRTSLGAEYEIRQVFDRVGQLSSLLFPNSFQDFEITEEGVWQPKYEKV